MKKKIVSLALCLCMVLTLMPAAAYAVNYPDGWDATATYNDGDTIIVGGISYTYGGEKTYEGLDFRKASAPSQNTVYKAGDGYILWDGMGILTLHDATGSVSLNDITGYAAFIYLPSSPTNIIMEGNNKIEAENDGGGSYSILSYSTITITLTDGSTTEIKANGGSASINAICAEGGLTINGSGALKMEASKKPGIMPGEAYEIYSDGTVYISDCTITSNEGISGTSTNLQNITIPEGGTLNLSSKYPNTMTGITNNGILILPDSKTVDDIKALALKGNGYVKLGTNYYLHDGTQLKVTNTNLDLSSGTSQGDLNTDGYNWDGSTLTVKNLLVLGEVTLPDVDSQVNIDGLFFADNLTFKTVQDKKALRISGGTLKSDITLMGDLTIDNTTVYSNFVNNSNTNNSGLLTIINSDCSFRDISWTTASGTDLKNNSTLTVGGEYSVFHTEKITMDDTSIIYMNCKLSNYGHLTDGLDGIKAYLPAGCEIGTDSSGSNTIIYSKTGEAASNIVLKKQTPSAPPAIYVPTIQHPEIIIVDNIGGTYELSILGTDLKIAADADYSLVSVTKNGENLGTPTQLKGLKTGDKVIIDFDKNLTPEEAKAASVKSLKLIARSKLVTMKTGKKAIRIMWYEKKNGKLIPVSTEFDGVEIYRSSKKAEGYGVKPVFVTKKDRYYNSAVKTGKTYFYKVRGFVTIGEIKVYTPYSTIAWRKVRA